MDLIQPIFQVPVLQATEWKCEGDRVAGIATRPTSYTHKIAYRSCYSSRRMAGPRQNPRITFQ
jgi:hypothetical protein